MLHKNPKILIYTFIIIFIFQLVGLFSLLLMPTPIKAVDFTPQVEVPGGPEGTITGSSTGEYVRAIYKYAIGIVGILATVVLMFGGILWIVAGGNAERVGNAKSWIGASLTGLILVLCSYMILKTVNPALVEFKPIYIATVKEMGCCEKDGQCSIATQEQCGSGWKGKEKFCHNNKCIQYQKKAGDKCNSINQPCDPNLGLKCLDYPLFKCTDGQKDSPCIKASDCRCGTAEIAECNNNKCECVVIII